MENVEKAGRNEQQKYDYVKAEDIAAAAQKALLEQGLLVEFEAVGSTETPIQSKQGTSGLIVKADCRLIVTDPSSGDQVTRSAIGYGADYPGDKAIYKAMTGARKYALIHLLSIPIGDDPDADAREQQQAPDTGKIGNQIAKKLVDRAWEVPGAKAQLQLAASHAAGRDVGDCGTKVKAAKAIAGLTFGQAEKLDRWIAKKAEGDDE